MKNRIFLTLLLIISPMVALAEVHETLIKNLKDSIRNHTFEVSADSFAFNVNGYACQWPGLKIPDWMLGADLNHYRKFGSDENRLAIGIKNPNHQHCSGLAGATDVFGKAYKEGAQVPVKINNRLDQIEREIIEETINLKQKLIRETITVTIFGRELESIQEIEVPNL